MLSVTDVRGLKFLLQNMLDFWGVVMRDRRVKSASQLAADQEYWISCEKVVMSAKDDME